MFYTKLFIIRLFLGVVGFCLVLLGCIGSICEIEAQTVKNSPKMSRGKSSKKLDRKEIVYFRRLKWIALFIGLDTLLGPQSGYISI